jgi:hypothetical protein
MKVRILRVKTDEHVNAKIIEAQRNVTLPSVTDGWRFNFKKHAHKRNVEAYILVCDDTPDIIEAV